MAKIHQFCDLLSFLEFLTVFNGRYLKKLHFFWILRIFEKIVFLLIFDPLLNYKREGDFFQSWIWMIFKTLRLFRGVRYEKSKKWKTRPQTHLKAPRFRICGLGPRFGAIWPQNLDFKRFWRFRGISSKDFRLKWVWNELFWKNRYRRLGQFVIQIEWKQKTLKQVTITQISK